MAENRALESISDDTIECFFYTSSPVSDKTFWQQLCERINKTIDTLSADYIWHRDEFKVHLPINNEPKDNIPAHLISTTCFGDNLEDEWFIVYLILEITKIHDNLIVQVKDSDGDFLLIEAADYLPSWANPDSTDNRVFIYKNHIHIIPPSVAQMNTELLLKDAIKFVVELTEQTKATEIHQAVLKRISNYPKDIKENIHRAIVKLPIDIATLLTLKPSLISPIVSTYCNHDIIDAKTCNNLSYEDCVTVQVKFSKCLYAMLIHAKLIKNVKHVILKESDKKSNIGLRLTCGYSMIMAKLSKEDLFSTKEFQKFLKILVENGYFKDNIEGSVNYEQLLGKAKDFFLNMECPINSYVSNKISQLLCSNEFAELKDLLENKDDAELDIVEDNEDWLNIHPGQLNDMLNARYGKQSKFANDDIITPQTMTSELSNFLKQRSDFEGIEPKVIDETESNDIEFDSEEFVNSLKNMLNIISSGNDLDVSSDFSDDDEGDAMEEEKDALDQDTERLYTYKDGSSINSKTILHNVIQSLKEEQGSTGPTSNILRTIGINKSDLLDSDDD